jgi:hypothetical protein
MLQNQGDGHLPVVERASLVLSEDFHPCDVLVHDKVHDLKV